MQQMDSQELDRRINAFLTRQSQKHPELRLRPQGFEEEKVHSITEGFADLIAGMKWEFGR